jgi:tyrosinase
MSHFVISGAKGGSTQGASAPNRLEINDLIKNGDQFSLYIQALSKLISVFTYPPTGLLTPNS